LIPTHVAVLLILAIVAITAVITGDSLVPLGAIALTAWALYHMSKGFSKGYTNSRNSRRSGK
jgi:hypothetical protein